MQFRGPCSIRLSQIGPLACSTVLIAGSDRLPGLAMNSPPSEFARIEEDVAHLREQYIRLRDENMMLHKQVHDLGEENLKLKHKSRKTSYYACARDEEVAALRKQIDDLKKQVRILTQHMTCPVCLLTMEEPHVLPCGHTYCKQCLDKIGNDTALRKCPTCRKTFHCMAPDYVLQGFAAAAPTLEETLAQEVPHACSTTNEELPTNENSKGVRCDWNESLSRTMMRHLRYINNDLERDPCNGYVKLSQLAHLLRFREESIYQVAISSAGRNGLRFEMSADGMYIRASKRSNEVRRRS